MPKRRHHHSDVRTIKTSHTFKIFNDFRNLLDPLIAEINLDQNSKLQEASKQVSFEDIQICFAQTTNESMLEQKFELRSLLGDLTLQITYSNVLLNTPLEPYYSLANTLRDAIKDDILVEGFSLESNRWISTLKVLFRYSLLPNYYRSSPSAKNVTYALAVNYFNSLNIGISINELDIKFPSYGVKLAVADTVNIPLRKLGGISGMNFIDKLLLAQFDPRIPRIRLHPNPDMMGNKLNRQVPHGLLYRLALKNLNSKAQFVNKNICCSKAIEASTHMAALHDVEPFSVYETMFPPKPAEIIRYLTRLTEYDELFLIPQCHPSIINNMLHSLRPKMECSISTLKLGWSIKDAITFWTLLATTTSHPVKSIFVNQKDLRSKLSQLVGMHTADALLKSFVFANVNQGYNYPTDAFQGDTRECCIARAFGEKYWIPGTLMLGTTFFSKLIALRAKHTFNFNETLGIAFENYLFDRLQSKGVSCKKGKLKGKTKRETAGDIDLLVETSEAIALFELKKKTLCRASTAGDGLQLLIDITHGLIKGVSQISRHEITLLQDGKIVFKDGSIVELNGRRIYKFVVSLGDFGSLHDSSITNHVLMSLAGSSFTIKADLSPKTSKDVELSKQYCAELAQRYFEFQAVTNNADAELFYNFSFLNIFQIEDSLANTTSADSFLKEILLCSRTSLGTRDRIVERFLLKPDSYTI